MNGLFKKFLEFAVGNGVVLLLGFISTPLIGRMIDPYQNGKAGMFITYTNLLVLVITMGIDQAYIRYYHEEHEDNKGRLLRRSIKLPMLINLIIGILLIVLYDNVSNLIIGETSLIIVGLLLFHSTVTIIGNFAMIHVRMKQNGKFYSLLSIVNKSVYLILLIALFFIFRNSYITMVLSTVLSNFLMVIIALYFERKDWFNFNKKLELKTTTKELVIYGVPFIFSMAITWVFQSIDRISIQNFSNFTEVGLYNGAMSIVGLLNAVQGAFTTFWVPVAYERYSTNSNDTKFFTDINQIVSAVMLLISIGIIATKDILIIILGKKYDGAQFIFPFLVLMPIMYTISETTVLGINFKKKTKYHIYIATFSAMFNVIGNLILVPTYGAKGAAISTGLAYVVFFLARTYYASKFYKIKFYMGRFWICTSAIYILAAYSSIYKFNYVIALLSIFSTILVIIMYREIIKKLFTMIFKNKRK